MEFAGRLGSAWSLGKVLSAGAAGTWLVIQIGGGQARLAALLFGWLGAAPFVTALGRGKSKASWRNLGPLPRVVGA